LPSDSDSGSSSSSNDKDISAYRDKLLESLKPTSEETELGDQITNVESSRDTGIQAVREKPIEMDPILGQSRNIENRAALELGTLESRLGRLVQDRQASSSVLSTALGFAVDDRTRQDQQGRYAQEDAFNERDFNESVRQFNSSESRLSKSGGGSTEEKEIAAFEKEAATLREQMQMYPDDANWAWAWSRLRQMFPNASIENIDSALGLDMRDKYDR